ncbi:MAG: AAA family ATPase [Spirochaetales bacterium]|nr:AAA family ATPase [Spirochaetales bacterium]MCF7937519.1 AAA family ATPase [Spirochaetales bacterium]
MSGHSIESAGRFLNDLVEELARVVRGKRTFLTYLVTAFVSGGHVLIEDLPGLGKTTVAKTLSSLIGGEHTESMEFRRIQFTPDLLPYDITGVDIYNPEAGGFHFQKGPVFANIVLADEINRTTPKVQSALLEVMAEGQVTIGNRTHLLEDLFFVIATQNPIEIEGTYPLPVAQLDRFMMRISLGYPDREAELAILTEDPSHTVLPDVQPVCGKEEILQVRNFADTIYCAPPLVEGVANLLEASRNHRGVRLGISPRGGLMLLKAARVLAVLRNRDFVSDQDLIDLAPQVLSHRIALRDHSLEATELIRELALYSLEGAGTEGKSDD